MGQKDRLLPSLGECTSSSPNRCDLDLKKIKIAFPLASHFDAIVGISKPPWLRCDKSAGEKESGTREKRWHFNGVHLDMSRPTIILTSRPTNKNKILYQHSMLQRHVVKVEEMDNGPKSPMPLHRSPPHGTCLGRALDPRLVRGHLTFTNQE